MPQRTTTAIRLSVLLAVLVLLAAACGGGGGEDGGDGGGDAGGGGGGEAVADQVDLSGVDITVGSKEFTEQVIVGQMAVAALSAAGANVTDQTGLSGTEVVRGALESGEIDMYWEYTGTGWITIQGNTERLEGSEAYYEAVRDADLEAGIVWLEPSEVNNTYAFFYNPAVNDLGITTISELAELAQTDPEQVTLCAATEFITRDDGLPGVTEAYGFEFSDVAELDLSLAINAAVEGEECTIGEIFQTDPLIVSENLTVLEDDQEFFPVYNLAATIRQDVYEADSDAYDQLFGAITDLLDNETMQELNGRVDLEGADPADVATDFLVEQGIISG
ncbi:MAG TPA: glycine betaine ABC transporter substrate-binding protein [Egibacteraceae bacterium]